MKHISPILRLILASFVGFFAGFCIADSFFDDSDNKPDFIEIICEPPLDAYNGEYPHATMEIVYFSPEDSYFRIDTKTDTFRLPICSCVVRQHKWTSFKEVSE